MVVGTVEGMVVGTAERMVVGTAEGTAVRMVRKDVVGVQVVVVVG
jgi:hypothetical protein